MYACHVKTVVSKESSGLGVDILAGVGAGIYSSVEAGCDRVIKINYEQRPTVDNTEKL